jgi:hemoglobin-like flavoprotein
VTPDQIDRVERLVKRVGASDEFAIRFYDRLFDAAPETRAMFPDLDAQRDKLRTELETLVRLIRNIDELEAEAGSLGARHRSYGVRAAHYRLARDAMTGALVDLLGDEFTAPDQAAWGRAYDLIAELMQA